MEYNNKKKLSSTVGLFGRANWGLFYNTCVICIRDFSMRAGSDEARIRVICKKLLLNLLFLPNPYLRGCNV